MLDSEPRNVNVEEVQKKLKDLIESLLKVAEKDLEAARVLYAHKLYPHAVFYAEQCAEKAAKASLVLCLQRKTQIATLLRKETQSAGFEKSSDQGTGLEDIVKKLKEVGHNVVKLVREQCTCMEEVSYGVSRYLFEFADKHRHILENTRLEGLETLARLFKKKSEEIGEICRSIVSWRLQELLKLSRSEERLLNYLSEIEGIYKDYTTVEPLVFMLGGLMKLIAPAQTSYAMGDLVQDALVGMRGAMLLGLLIVLSPHATRSRYPKMKFNPLDEYTENLPLIRHFDKVLKLLEEAFKIAETREKAILKDGTLQDMAP